MGMLNLKSFEDFLYESTVKKIKIENQEKFYNLLINRTSLSEENGKDLQSINYMLERNGVIIKENIWEEHMEI